MAPSPLAGEGWGEAAYKAWGLLVNYRKSKPAHDLPGVAHKYLLGARASECAEVSHGYQYPNQASPVPGPLDRLAGPAFAQPLPAGGEGPGPVEHRASSWHALAPS